MFRKGDATSAPVETMISKECELLGSLATKGACVLTVKLPVMSLPMEMYWWEKAA